MVGIVELGDPVLRKTAQPIKDPTAPSVRMIVDQMIRVLKKERGIGIAAPQIGVSEQLFIVAPNQKLASPYTDIKTGVVVINPTISFMTDKQTYEWEGCLSIPGIRGYVPRQCDIMIEYTNLLGEKVSESYTGFTARIFLHEYDHLMGNVFLDHIEDIKSHIITDGYYIKQMEDES